MPGGFGAVVDQLDIHGTSNQAANLDIPAICGLEEIRTPRPHVVGERAARILDVSQIHVQPAVEPLADQSTLWAVAIVDERQYELRT